MSIKSLLLKKLTMDELRYFLDDNFKSKRLFFDIDFDEDMIKALSELDVPADKMNMFDDLWCQYPNLMAKHFKNRLTKRQFKKILPHMPVIRMLADLLDDEQVSHVIIHGDFGIHVGDVFKNNPHYKRKYGIGVK